MNALALKNFEEFYKLSAGVVTIETIRRTEKGIQGWANKPTE